MTKRKTKTTNRSNPWKYTLRVRWHSKNLGRDIGVTIIRARTMEEINRGVGRAIVEMVEDEGCYHVFCPLPGDSFIIER